jgi:group II intron reverse transcriptase/maturase
MGGKDEMTKASSSLQDLRRGIYVKAKAEPSWRFWGLYVHVCKMDALREAYALARKNNGAPGIDGVTFEAIEAQGVEAFLEQIQGELIGRTYVPLRARRQEIPKDGGKVRVLSIPAIRDRVVQGALKLILEPIFEADFQPGSYGYRPKRTAHEAVHRVAAAIVQCKTRVIDLDLRAYFDTVRHHLLLEKVARRIKDDDVMHLLKLMLTASGKQGVPQGGVISPLLSNIYLTEVDRMLERAKEATRNGKYTYVEYARFADDLVVLIDAHPRHMWLLGAVTRRLRECGGRTIRHARQVGIESQCNILCAHRIDQPFKRTRFENGCRLGWIPGRWRFYVWLVLSMRSRWMARLTRALVLRSRISPMWLTHKVGLSAGEVTINAGIISEGLPTPGLSSANEPFW